MKKTSLCETSFRGLPDLREGLAPTAPPPRSYGPASTAWISSNPICKHIILILESPSFIFRCKICIGNSIPSSCPIPIKLLIMK